METPITHIVQSQVIEVVVPQEEMADAACDMGKDFFQEKVLPVLEAELDAIEQPGIVLKIERLNLDFGVVKDLNRISIEEIQAKVRGALAEILAIAESPDGKGRGVEKVPVQVSQFEILLHFLERGELPWNFPTEKLATFRPWEELAAELKEAPFEWKRRLIELLNRAPVAIRRIATQAPKDIFLQLLQVIEGNPEGTAIRVFQWISLILQQWEKPEMARIATAIHTVREERVKVELLALLVAGRAESPVSYLEKLVGRIFEGKIFSKGAQSAILLSALPWIPTKDWPTMATFPTEVVWGWAKQDSEGEKWLLDLPGKEWKAFFADFPLPSTVKSEWKAAYRGKGSAQISPAEFPTFEISSPAMPLKSVETKKEGPELTPNEKQIQKESVPQNGSLKETQHLSSDPVEDETESLRAKKIKEPNEPAAEPLKGDEEKVRPELKKTETHSESKEENPQKLEEIPSEEAVQRMEKSPSPDDREDEEKNAAQLIYEEPDPMAQKQKQAESEMEDEIPPQELHLDQEIAEKKIEFQQAETGMDFPEKDIQEPAEEKPTLETLAQLPLEDRFKAWQEIYRENPQVLYPKPSDPIPFFSEKPFIFAENAGLLLLWPFIGHLLKGLGWTNDTEFLDVASRDRAIALLHYIATGEYAEIPEHLVIVPKLLCGMDIQEVWPAQTSLTDAEKEAGDGMVKAAIAYWSVLGGLSVEGMRDTFLKRTGKLTFDGSGILISIERKALDILLDRLPWGISTIKMPWQPQIIHMQW